MTKTTNRFAHAQATKADLDRRAGYLTLYPDRAKPGELDALASAYLSLPATATSRPWLSDRKTRRTYRKERVASAFSTDPFDREHQTHAEAVLPMDAFEYDDEAEDA